MHALMKRHCLLARATMRLREKRKCSVHCTVRTLHNGCGHLPCCPSGMLRHGVLSESEGRLQKKSLSHLLDKRGARDAQWWMTEGQAISVGQRMVFFMEETLTQQYGCSQEQKPSRVAQAAVAGLAALMLAAGPAISADKESLRCVTDVQDSVTNALRERRQYALSVD